MTACTAILNVNTFAVGSVSTRVIELHLASSLDDGKTWTYTGSPLFAHEQVTTPADGATFTQAQHVLVSGVCDGAFHDGCASGSLADLGGNGRGELRIWGPVHQVEGLAYASVGKQGEIA